MMIFNEVYFNLCKKVYYRKPVVEDFMIDNYCIRVYCGNVYIVNLGFKMIFQHGLSNDTNLSKLLFKSMKHIYNEYD